MSTGVLDQIPRSSLALLLVGQAAVIAPHVPRLSIWILLVWLLAVVWRVLIFTGRWGYPGTWVKAGLLMLAAVGVGLSYGQLYGLEPAVALLVVAFVLKLLEMHDRRDALVVIYLGYFIIATEFLFVQTMGITGYALLAVVLVTAALVGLNQSWNHPQPLASLRKSAVLLLQAVPLTIVMFVFFPRIAPLWSVPMPVETARTGLTDNMTPGQVAQLSRSEELAFRVDFQGEVPAQSELYWRAITYSRYEDGTWSTGRVRNAPERLIHWQRSARAPGWLERIEPGGAPVRYSVLAEASYQPWLYALDYAEPLTPGTGIGRDFRVLNRAPLASRMRYEVVSWPETTLDVELPPWLAERETRLQDTGNPRTRTFVEAVAAQTDSPLELARLLLDMFRNESFFYTLEPPTLETDAIDGFLFDTRQGFCAHYAGAFVYMMRLAGVPARMVAGYQGGELNPMGDHLVVRQYDAHAWAEIWIAGRGWLRVDPTAAVAPSRVEQGAQAAFAEGGEAVGETPLKGFHWTRLPIVLDLLYYIDSMEHRWNVLVVGYDATVQSRFLRDVLGEVTPTRIAIAVSIAAALAILIASSGTLLAILRQRRDPVRKLYDEFCGAFRRAGLPRRADETPRSYARRLERAFPELATEIALLTGWVDDALFGPAADPQGAHPDAGCRGALWRIRLRLTLRRLRGPAASPAR